MADWRSIDTAPKDGQHVILAVYDNPPPYVSEGYWDEDAEKWFQANTHSTDYYDGSMVDVRYWTPLPTPPQR